MATEIKMPQLSDTMSSGKIVAWRKSEGEAVARGDILAEVETDKANLEIECFHPGTLLKIVTPAGSTAKVGEAIALVGQAGETAETTTQAKEKESVEKKPEAVQSVAPVTQKADSQEATPAQSSPLPPTQPLQVVNGGSQQRVVASPLAKKVAEQLQVNLASVVGTGPEGRIVKKDVEMVAGGSPATTPQSNATQPLASPVAAPSTSAQATLTPFSKMRETIARRMQESMQTSPHFYVSASIVMDEALRLRELLKAEETFKGLSVNHMVIKACGYALEKEPRVNATVKDNQTLQPGSINIGIITSVGEGLLIPVVKEVNTLSLKDVVFEAKAAVDRARAGRPNSSDLVGGTFSISNMGMFDVENFTAIINPGQGGILAVGATKETPVAVGGQIKVAQVMKVTVSVDHRIIDGLMAATFLNHFKKALETPALLFV